MRIGVDVMGGDNAPQAILDGAVASLDQLDPDDELILVGSRDVIDPVVSGLGERGSAITIIGTTQVIAMNEPPVEAVRAKFDQRPGNAGERSKSEQAWPGTTRCHYFRREYRGMCFRSSDVYPTIAKCASSRNCRGDSHVFRQHRIDRCGSEYRTQTTPPRSIWRDG